MAGNLTVEQVLIETYWNVKYIKFDNLHDGGSINRNILECKGHAGRKEGLERSVLIETYWNVKKENGRTYGKQERVLIETYWNVKAIVSAVETAAQSVLIETYWNVKQKKVMKRQKLSGY